MYGVGVYPSFFGEDTPYLIIRKRNFSKINKMCNIMILIVSQRLYHKKMKISKMYSFLQVMNNNGFPRNGKGFKIKFRFGVNAFQDQSLCSRFVNSKST
jgi:hypothetical protein